MKHLFYLTSITCLVFTPMDGQMNELELLKQLENCYDAMLPATENNQQTFAWFSDIPHPLLNAVMYLSSENVPEKIDSLIAKVPPGNPISFWVHPQNRAIGLIDLLRERGFALMVTCPFMAWEVKPQKIPNVDIELVGKNMDAFNEITRSVFHFDDATIEKYSKLLERIESENYLIFLDGKPIGTGVLFMNEKVGGIFNIAILPEYQKRGCARAMMEFLMHRAFQLHLERLVLLSSPESEKLYLNLGFNTVFNIDIYAR